MTIKSQRLDEGEILWFENQLQKINSKVFEKKYPKFTAREVFPVNNEPRPGVKKLTSRLFDEVGMAKIVSNYSDDAPRVDLLAKEYDVKVRKLADAYGYSTDDIKAANLAGEDLDGRKASVARRKMLVTENRLAWFGDSNYSIQGFLNHPNIPSTTVLADGQGNDTTFESKASTPDKIIRDIMELFDSVEEQSNGVHAANTLLLPTNKKAVLRTRVTDTGMTILQYIKENNPEIQNIVWVKELKNPFGNGNMMVAGEFDPEIITLEITEEFDALEPQLRNFEYVINCSSSIAGVDVRFPLAFAFADGI